MKTEIFLQSGLDTKQPDGQITRPHELSSPGLTGRFSIPRHQFWIEKPRRIGCSAFAEHDDRLWRSEGRPLATRRLPCSCVNPASIGSLSSSRAAKQMVAFQGWRCTSLCGSGILGVGCSHTSNSPRRDWCAAAALKRRSPTA